MKEKNNRFFFAVEGMRIPIQDIPIVNNHPVNFERRIWPKSHPRAGSFLAKIHGTIKNRIKNTVEFFSLNSNFKYHCLGIARISWCISCALF